MIKYIVFLGLGINQIEFIEAAKSLGYKIIGFDRREPSYCREICDHYYQVAINKKYAVQEIVSNFTNIIGCISEQTDTALETVGFIITAFVFLFATLRYLHKSSWQRSFLLAFMVLVIIYVIFRLIFQVVLPEGIVPEREIMAWVEDLFITKEAQ